jgi:hypothetical protein
MGLDLLAKFSVVDKVDPTDGQELFDNLLADDEEILLSYKHRRDRVIFTDRKIIAIDIQGLTGKKKEFRVFPYTKITSFAVETAGTFDLDSDFRIWVSGVGVFEVKFGSSINIKEIGALLSDKVR